MCVPSYKRQTAHTTTPKPASNEPKASCPEAYGAGGFYMKGLSNLCCPSPLPPAVPAPPSPPPLAPFIPAWPGLCIDGMSTFDAMAMIQEPPSAAAPYDSVAACEKEVDSCKEACMTPPAWASVVDSC